MRELKINDINLLKYCHERVGGYGETIGDEFPKECVSFGQYRDDGEPLWVVVFHSFKESHDCVMEYTLNNKGPMAPSLFKMICRVSYDYIFNQAKLRRCSSVCRISNTASLKITKAIGMKQEGIRRLGFQFPEPEDMVLFGMLKEECPWI